MRVPPLLVWLALALTVISLGAAAGPVVWRLAGETGQRPPATMAQPDQPAPRTDLGPVLAFAPFGSAAQPQAAAPELAGETALGLTLLGVTIATPASASRAIIAGAEPVAQSYAVGAAITDAALLHAVAADHVVLRVGDRLETLSFTKPGAAAPATAGTDLRNLIPQQGAAAAPAPDNAPDAVIARYRNAIQQDAQGVMDRLGLEITDQGYRITDQASPGVRQAGFRPGDVVTTVNGQKVGDMAADRGYFDEVAASGRARVEIQRDGQSIVMSFPLR
ncbi:hypothetical protein GEU84_000030 [Fertoebacter nigrum]|uniref:PDZ domain-containing protein n=1 Tax=Fertoeibacter niger TaxID=2656921 RepID=A0A8X8GZQ1_9RHOB|nr:type II secretion system protein N [Fertoeibacter niger]NUB42758.1 hypothetical protein [Fertoeibacter niger]